LVIILLEYSFSLGGLMTFLKEKAYIKVIDTI
jgi:hypothetical protein